MSKKNLFIFFFALAIISVMVSGWYLGSASAVDYIFTNSHGDLTISTDTMISDCENSAYAYSPDNTLFFKSSCKIFYTNSDSYGEIYQYYDYVHMFYLNDDAQISVSENNGVYTFTSDTRFRYQNYGYAWRESLNGQYYFADNPGYRSDWHNNDWCYTIIYDSNNNTITCDNSDMFPAVHYFGDTYDLQSLSASWDIGDNHYNSDGLNVYVQFSPDLSGDVDRCLSDSSGNVGYMQNLFMSVTNNNLFPIQYMMYIYKKNKTNLRTVGCSSSVSYDDDPVFSYYEDDWVYTQPYDNDGDQWALETSYQYKPTYVHYVYAGQTDEVKFDFSQINLQEGVEYECVVMAQKCDYDRASEKHTQVGITEDRLYTELYQVDYLSYENVYYSTFTMLHYNDVTYDPSNSSWGVLPYSGSSGQLEYQKYATSRHAIEDENGNINYNDYSLYDDPNSWRSKQEQFASHGNYAISDLYTPSNSSYGTLLSKVSVVFTFFASVLGFFPSDVLIVYNLALWSIVILLIIRRLH